MTIQGLGASVGPRDQRLDRSAFRLPYRLPDFGQLFARVRRALGWVRGPAAFGVPERESGWYRDHTCLRVAVFLASDEATYVTGSEFNIDGGLLAGSAASPG